METALKLPVIISAVSLMPDFTDTGIRIREKESTFSLAWDFKGFTIKIQG